MKIAIPRSPAHRLNGILLGMLILAVLSHAQGQIGESSLRRDLANLWDGSWVNEHLTIKQKPLVQMSGLNVALSIHQKEFSWRSAVEREWQLAEIRSSISQPDMDIQAGFPSLYHHLVNLSETLVEDYTRLHEDLFDRDTEWERLRSQVFIDFEGKSLRSGELLARAINHIRERNMDAEEDKIKSLVYSVIDRRIQDYLFAFNNGTATNRRQIRTVWSQEPVSLQPPEIWQLSDQAADAYKQFLETYLEKVTDFQSDLEYAFNNPKFVTRRGISPAVGDILQILSENYFEYETYARWFSQNETLMNEALVIVDMRSRATPHEVVKLDPVTLKPTDLNEALQQTTFVDTITVKRRELLLKYIAIREELNGEIEEAIINRKKLLSPEEEEVLWREYQKMKDLTRSASSTP
ncbi:MAG: hypothetical protein O7C75_17830 [Verrucomicrobia bacterium]|nr:hypothetical protein [Verrucomicrobiota bacterium]